jgi:hypothetical protein
MIKKFFKETSALSWTLGGTALVLITLSGPTKVIGLWISAFSLIVHFLGVLFSPDEEKEEDTE